MHYRLLLFILFVCYQASLYSGTTIHADSVTNPFNDYTTLAGAGPKRTFLTNWPFSKDQNTKYSFKSSVPDIVFLRISNDTLLVYPISSGSATVAVTASDSYGNIIQADSFRVIVAAIMDSGIRGQVTYDNEQKTPLAGTAINLISNGMASGLTYCTSKGFYIFDLNQWGTFSVSASSAENLPDPVNSTDALLAVKYFADPGSYNLSELRRMAADVNKDGRINATDALIIQRRFLNLIDSFPAGTWTFSQSTVTIDVSTVKVPIIDIRGILIGDVNGSFFQSN